MSRIAVVLLSCAAVFAVSACAGHAKKRELELGKIGEWLPGQYDTSAQVDADLNSGAVEVHPAMQINLVPVWARFVGDQVLYVEQADTRSGRRIVLQQLYSFEKSSDEKTIIQHVYDFKEPQRWSAGDSDPEIFKSLVPDDLKGNAPCDLVWTLEGDIFKGTAGRKGCPIRKMEFDGLELRIDAVGRPAGDWLRFRRVGAED